MASGSSPRRVTRGVTSRSRCRRISGLVVLAGQAVYTVDEWAGEPDELEGRSGAPDRDAYDQSLQRLRELEPEQVYFGHDRRSWQRIGS